MMKIAKRFLVVSIIVGLFYSSFSNVNNVYAANNVTLGYYEQQLANYKKKAEETRKAINKTESEIRSSEGRIENLKNETATLSNEIKKLNEEIENYKKSIEEKLSQSRQVLEYMQLSNDRNVYLDYVFKADSITDLINRSYTIQELMDYNNRTVGELEQIIKDNEKRQAEIDKRKEKIKQTQTELEHNIVSLGEEKAVLTTGGVDTASQIKMYEELVNAYKKRGCKTNDIIGVDCAVQGGTGIFRRPTTTGYITQEQYYNNANSYHRAVDIGSKNGRREKIYPIADGTIVAKYTDIYGALVLAIEHYNITDGKWYTSLYAHMSSYAPGLKIGNKVTSNQYIGYMGDTGYSFGIHLHMEVIPCRLNNPSDRNCYSLNAYLNYAPKVIRNGFNLRKLISFPKGLYNSWYSR